MQEEICGGGRLVRELMEPGVLPGSADGVDLIETHISWVLLAGEHAWKLKKPLDLGFLDFSTPARRREAARADIRGFFRDALGYAETDLSAQPHACELTGALVEIWDRLELRAAA